jgi:hypothetical protein
MKGMLCFWGDDVSIRARAQHKAAVPAGDDRKQSKQHTNKQAGASLTFILPLVPSTL